MSDDREPPRPGDPLPNETAQAYRAYQIYQGLGPDRSVEAAYAIHRERNGSPAVQGQRGGGKRARSPGCWTRWSTQNEWIRRAIEWDRHLAGVRRGATEDAEKDQVRRWIRRRDALDRQQYVLGKRLLRLSSQLIGRPEADRPLVSSDSTPAPLPDPMDLRRTAALVREATDLTRSAIASALDLAPPEDGPGVVTEEELNVAAQRLEAWRSKQRLAILQLPTAPPESNPEFEPVPLPDHVEDAG